MNGPQPANIGARGAWTAGCLEFNWSPGFLGHSAFTEERVWAAVLATEEKGDVVRVYEYDRYNGTVFQVDLLLDGAELWTHTRIDNPNYARAAIQQTFFSPPEPVPTPKSCYLNLCCPST